MYHNYVSKKLRCPVLVVIKTGEMYRFVISLCFEWLINFKYRKR